MPRIQCTVETYQSVTHEGKRVVQRHFEPGDIVDWPDGVPFPRSYFTPVGKVGLTDAERALLNKLHAKMAAEEPTGAVGPKDTPDNVPGFKALMNKKKPELLGIYAQLGGDADLARTTDMTKGELSNNILRMRIEGQNAMAKEE